MHLSGKTCTLLFLFTSFSIIECTGAPTNSFIEGLLGLPCQQGCSAADEVINSGIVWQTCSKSIAVASRSMVTKGRLCNYSHGTRILGEMSGSSVCTLHRWQECTASYVQAPALE